MELWHQITLGAVLFLLVVVHYWLLISARVEIHHVRVALWGYIERATDRHLEVKEKLSLLDSGFMADTKLIRQDQQNQHGDLLININRVNNNVAELTTFMVPHNIDIAASILEAHFRKKKDDEGLMLVNSIRPLLQRKVPRKKKQTDIDRIQSDS